MQNDKWRLVLEGIIDLMEADTNHSVSRGQLCEELKAALMELRLKAEYHTCEECGGTGKIKKDRLNTCPECNGWSDGHDRCDPPNPYVCHECQANISKT